MSFKRDAAIKILLMRGVNVNEDSIQAVITEMETYDSIDMSTFSFADEIELYLYICNQISNFRDFEKYSERITSLIEKVEDDFAYINRRLSNSTYDKVKAARLGLESMSGESLTYLVDINKQNMEEGSTALIVNDEIVAGLAKDNGDNRSIDTTSVDQQSILVEIDGETDPGVILEKQGTVFTVADNKKVIKESGIYKIRCNSAKNTKTKITVNIDLNKEIEIESICPVFENVEKIKILKSKNKKTFSEITGRTLSKDRVFFTKREAVRYITIIIYKDKATSKSANKFIYDTIINQIKISSEFEKEQVVFETKAELIGSNLSKVSISTIDNYDDKDITIDYKIKINEEEWQSIRPINKTGNIEIPSIVSCSNNFDNKIVELSDYTYNDEKVTYSLAIPQEFIASNNIDYMSNINEWNYREGFYEAWVFNYTDKTVDIGSKTISVNNQKTTGVISISKGLSIIEVAEADFVKLFNKSFIKSYVKSGSSVLVTLPSGSVSTIIDSEYPYNVKLLIEESSDFLYGKKLIEHVDFNILNNTSGDGAKIVKDNNGIVHLIYHNLYSAVYSIKIKGTLNSSNNSKIARISQIIIRGE